MAGRLLIVATLTVALVACDSDSPTPSPTPTTTPDPTRSATAPSPAATPTSTPFGTATAAPTSSPTPGPTPTPSPTPEPGATPTPIPDPTVSPTPTPTRPQPDEPADPLEPDSWASRLPRSPVFDTPPGVYTDITVGSTHACALTENAEAVCWDVGSTAAWDTPPGSYLFIETERDTTCAITDEGEIVCWSRGGAPIGDGEPDPSRDSPQGRYKALAWDTGYVSGLVPSGHYTCALTEEGAIVCWGLEGSGFDRALFPPDPPSGSYTAIRVEHDSPGFGAHFLTACALAETGALVCWGSGHGHLHPFGPPETSRRSGDYELVGDVFCNRSGDGGPIFIGRAWCHQSSGSDSTSYRAVSPGETHTCAITDGGTAVCEADRISISYEIGGVLSVMTPPEPSPDRYAAISMGDTSWEPSVPVVHVCALTESGRAVCWTSVPNKLERPEPSLGPYVAVSDGLGHTCALTGGGEAVCWGWNNFGQAQVPSGRYTAVSAGHGSTWAITGEGKAVRWGGNSPPWSLPSAAERYVAVSAGDFNGGCALTESRKVVCWPEKADLPEVPLESISLGWGGYGCALTEGGEVACFRRSWAPYSDACGGSSSESGCWGLPYGGESVHEPPPGPYRMVSVGQSHACGVTQAGEVVCWDYRRDWLLSASEGPYVAVSTGLRHDCALTDRGEVQCRGSFGNSKLGIDYGPVEAPPGRHTAITSGHHRACALTEAGEVVCWGDTDYEEWPNFWRPWEE